MLYSDQLYNKFQGVIEKELSKYNFIKQKKGYFKRCTNECIQYINFSITKTRGRDELYLMLYARVEFNKLDRIISYLKKEDYDKRYPTLVIPFAKIINVDETYAFYLNKDTDIMKISSSIIIDIEKYILTFFESCDTLEKYERLLLNRDNRIISSIIMEYEWNLLGISVLLKRNYYTNIIEEYKNIFIEKYSDTDELYKSIKNVMI